MFSKIIVILGMVILSGCTTTVTEIEYVPVTTIVKADIITVEHTVETVRVIQCNLPSLEERVSGTTLNKNDFETKSDVRGYVKALEAQVTEIKTFLDILIAEYNTCKGVIDVD